MSSKLPLTLRGARRCGRGIAFGIPGDGGMVLFLAAMVVWWGYYPVLLCRISTAGRLFCHTFEHSRCQSHCGPFSAFPEFPGFKQDNQGHSVQFILFYATSYSLCWRIFIRPSDIGHRPFIDFRGYWNSSEKGRFQPGRVDSRLHPGMAFFNITSRLSFDSFGPLFWTSPICLCFACLRRHRPDKRSMDAANQSA